MAKIKVRAIGNSLGVILPAELLARLRIGEGDELFAAETAGGIELTPYDPEFAETMKAFDSVRRKYRNTLHKLAR